MTSVPIRPHTRRKPSKPAAYIETHERLRREVEDMQRKANTPKARLAVIVEKLNALIGRVGS